jgi:hypothetical protein
MRQRAGALLILSPAIEVQGRIVRYGPMLSGRIVQLGAGFAGRARSCVKETGIARKRRNRRFGMGLLIFPLEIVRRPGGSSLKSASCRRSPW